MWAICLDGSNNRSVGGRMKQPQKRKVIFFVICFSLCLAGSFLRSSFLFAAEDNPAVQGNVGGPEYSIGMGDVLEVNVWNEADLSKEVFVRLDGRISLPLVGDIPASGHTPRELAESLTNIFSKFVSSPSVSVIVTASKSKRYYVVGQIGKPGEWPIEHPITVLQAIARAGGFLEWANVSKIQIVRQEVGKGKILDFDYEALAKKSDLGQNIMIEPGDTIIVP